ncbi:MULTISPECIES: GvpL/GvpF family gas vesicle protein [Amycolatopsis]|uniref:GvpL/GvpF family gas vesicle protein n=1 Tax=Amycolatopsis dendrobii TaxID=2760662 RepID=A0A7W3W254_9PSEU|nr:MULTISPECIES: GvpL/GvpF family gas vesicle protein [Amycolatopsis]MBB1157464.1 GvpL/GvpF family gas vesicle protein [Amycolatopsis dendrobii]UKD59142.1 GvpL/GvpF family gas vesicle protein [Amycolatopsis sp. FU40]
MSWYCYAVAEFAAENPMDGITGLRDRPVSVISGAGLAALASPAPDEGFDETSLEQLPWLEEIARAHNAVVEEASRRTGVLPLRMATIYRDEQRVREMLAEHSAQFSEALRRIRGHAEWGVKVFASLRGSGTHEPPADGRSYLRQRLRQRQARDTRANEAVAVAERIERELAQLSADLHRHRNQDPALTGRTDRNILNLACLVPDAGRERFLDRLAQLRRSAAAGIEVEVTGPWAPYSFAGIS